jgi:hypothetical protein
MITHPAALAPSRWLALLVSFSLAGLLLLRAAPSDVDADVKSAATAAMETWLEDIDAGHYEQSWKNAGALFQKAITAEGWKKALDQARKPLGACNRRKLLGAKYLTQLPGPNGTIEGEFVVAQFETAFTELPRAIETVPFAKEDDGTWKSVGYFVKPRE